MMVQENKMKWNGMEFNGIQVSGSGSQFDRNNHCTVSIITIIEENYVP